MSQIIRCNPYIKIDEPCFDKCELYTDYNDPSKKTQLPYELAMMAYSCYVAPTHTRTLEERLEALEAK